MVIYIYIFFWASLRGVCSLWWSLEGARLRFASRVYCWDIFMPVLGHVQVILRSDLGYIEVIWRPYGGRMEVIFRSYGGHI